jgi:hypothetical protein
MPIKLSNIISKIFGTSSSPSSPAPSLPKTGEEWVAELDLILNKHQEELDKFYQRNIGNRLLRRNINQLRINEPPNDLGLPKKPLPIKMIPGAAPAIPKKPGDLDPRKKDLPINSIMESGQRLFRAYHTTLSSIIKEAYEDVHQYLVKLSTSFGHHPADNQFKTLLTDLVRGKITGLDKQARKEIVGKLKVFIKVTQQLQSWIVFFKRTENQFSKKKKI